MRWFKRSKANMPPDLASSILYDERDFYNRFRQDLLNAKEEVIIESPYITIPRLRSLKPVFGKLVGRGVNVFVITKSPEEHDDYMAEQSRAGIDYFEVLGVQVLLCGGGHHRKLAMIDRKILWEGSLNILSQSHSREFMRRIDSQKLTEEMFRFLRYYKIGFFKKKLNLL